jgi:hypothetical protein
LINLIVLTIESYSYKCLKSDPLKKRDQGCWNYWSDCQWYYIIGLYFINCTLSIKDGNPTDEFFC